MPRMVYEDLRAALVAKIHEANRARREAATVVTCAHSWQRFKQTVPTTNEAFHGSAYFVVNACTLCKAKNYHDYVLTRS